MSAKFKRKLGVAGWAVLLGFLGWVALAGQFNLRIRQANTGAVVLDWDSSNGVTYEVYWSTNLAAGTGSWQFFGQVTAGGPTSTITDVGAINRAFPSSDLSRFYRVRSISTTQITSDITANTTWSFANSPYIITTDIHVQPGVTLTIAPGVRVLLTGSGKLTVDGCLQVLGTAAQPVTFTSGRAVPQRGDWVGLAFTATSSNCVGVLSNVVVEYAQVGIASTDTSPKIYNSTIRFSSQQGIYLTRSSPLIQGCAIQQNSSYGIYCFDTSSPQVIGSRIVLNSSYGIYANGTSVAGHNPLPLLRGDTFDRNSSYAVVAGGYYLPGQTVIDARSNWWGTADANVIATQVYDYADNPNGSAVVNFGNWLMTEGGQAVGGRFVSGQILGTALWQTTDSPIGVIGPLLVTSNANLTIQPGVEVDFYGNYALQVDGSLQSLGTAANPVVFTSSEDFPAAGDWQGLTCTSNSVCVLSNTVVEFAQVALRSTDTSPVLVNSAFQFCSQQGIYLTRSSPLISGCVIQQNSSYGIYALDTCSPQILSSQIIANNSYGISLNGTGVSNHNCLPVIHGSTISGNVTYALYAYNYFQPALATVDARSNWWGTADAIAIAGLIYDYANNTTYSPVVNFGNWLGSQGGVALGGKFFSGVILSNTVWQTTESPIGIIGPLLVSSNTSLTIQPGVQVVVYGNYALQVDGTLQALGLSNSPIVFTSGKSVPQRGDWQGLVFTAGSGGNPCVLSNTVVQYAQIGVNCTATSPQILASTIQFCSQQGIYLTRSSPLIQGCTIQQNNSYGIWAFDTSSPQILQNQILGNGSYGVYLNGTSVSGHNCLATVQGNTFLGNTSYALEAYFYYQANQVTIDARNNWWGTTDPVAIAAMIYDYNDNTTWSPVVNFGNWLASQGGAPVPGRTVSGQILSNTVWQASDSPVSVVGSLLVASNVSLTIQPGVRVLFYGNYPMQIDGCLQALGSSNQPVTFSSGKAIPQRGDWQGLNFTAGSTNNPCILSNAVIQYAQVGVRCTDTSPSIVNSTVQFCNAQGIYLTQSSSLIQACTIQGNSSYGIYCSDASSPQILGNQVVANSSYGIAIVGTGVSGHNSLPHLQGNTLDRNTTYAVYAGSFYQPAGIVIDARNNWWGTADGSVIAGMVYDYTDNPGGSPAVNFGNWLNSQNGTPVPGRFVSGQLLSNTIWQTTDSPIGILGPVIVTSNTSLTIQPGVEVDFYGNYALQVDGGIQALGTVAKPVVFTGAEEFPLPGDWQGLVLTASSTNSLCVFSNTIVEYAQVGIRSTDTSFRMAGGAVQYCSQQGIYLTRSSPAILGCTVQQNASYGIYCLDTSSPQILGSQIVANGSYGISLNGTGLSGHNCLPVIQGSTLLGNGSYALVAQSFFQAGQVTIDARSNWWGTADATVIVGLVYDYADSGGSPVVNFGNWLLSSSGPASPVRGVAGQLVGSTVWQTTDSPFGLIGPLLVTSNASLTIQPGVQVFVYGNFPVQVDGTLQGLGSSNNPIVFTSGKVAPLRGDWQGVNFNIGSSNNPCVLSNVVVQYAQSGVTCVSASPAIVNSTIQFCSAQGINLTRSSPLIQGCAIQQNNSYGIYVYDTSSPLILGNQVLSNSSYGIYLSGTSASGHNSQPILSGNTLLGNSSYALLATSYFQPNQVIIDARSNWWGTADAIAIASLVYDYSDNPGASPIVNYGNWFLTQAGPPVPGQFVSGLIQGNVVWQTSDSPVGLIGSVQVASNASLTIQPGVQVLVYGNYGLQVDGTLQALGRPGARVVFTSGRVVPQKSDWPGLKFTAGSTNNSCLLSNVVVEFADIAVNAVQTSPGLVNSQLRQNRVGVYLDRSSPLIGTNLVELNDTGISCYQSSSPLIVGNTVTLNRFNGVEIISSTTSQDFNPHPLLSANSIFTNALAGASYYSLYAISFYQPASNTIVALSNWWGTTDSNLVRQSIYYYSNNPGSSPFVSFSPFLVSNINYTPYGASNSAVWFSPNADGAGDSISVAASLTALSSWSVAMVDLTGTTARTLTGSGPNVSVIWDGTNQLGNPAPEGRYRAIITATNINDGRVSVEYGGASVLDRTYPVGIAAADTLADGMVANQLVLRGTVSDNAFQGYVIDYGLGLSPSSFTLLVTNAAPIVGGILGQLDSRSLSNGVYTFRLRVYDYAGNITTTLVVLTVDNVIISNPDAPTVFFDPALGSDSITFGLNKTSDVTLTLSPVTVTADTAGNMTITLTTTPVRTFSLHLPPGPVNVPWDGRNDLGIVVSNATYAFRIFVQAALGRTNAYDPVYVSGPVSFTTNGFSTNFNFQANDPIAISYSLFAPAFIGLGLASPVSGSIIAGVARDAGPNTEYWSGRLPSTHQVINGAFQVNLLTRVMPENSIVVNHQPSVTIGSLKTESYVVTPSSSEVSLIYYSLQRQADITLWLRDPNGNRISLLQQNARPAGSYNFEWNGNFDSVSLPSIAGDYEVHLDTVDSVTGDLQSVIGNLTVRR